MTQEFESQLRQLFSEANTELPAEAFTARLMSETRRQRRHERLIWSACGIAVLVFACLTFVSLEPLIRSVAVAPPALLESAADMVSAWPQSPLVYAYGVALGGYLLLVLVRRARWRLI